MFGPEPLQTTHEAGLGVVTGLALYGDLAIADGEIESPMTPPKQTNLFEKFTVLIEPGNGRIVDAPDLGVLLGGR